MGTFAEYAVCRVDKIVRRPASITSIAAVVTAISGLTALRAERDHGRVSSGQKVLVIGASGGVGSFAVQLAAAFGADVTAPVEHREDRCGRDARSQSRAWIRGRTSRQHPL